jgi:SAM-dependent methyltransferase
MYCLEDKKETTRLEEQNSHALYSISDELNKVNFSGIHKVLDAGCGSGFVTRSLLDLFPDLDITGIDYGIDRVEDARKIAKEEGKNAKFLEASLYKLPFKDGEFDMVISRFVFHHLDDHQKAMDELYRVVKPGGQVVIIDSDGILFNFYTKSNELMSLLDKLHKCFSLDFFSARKLKSFMSRSAGKNLKSSLIPMHFSGEDLVFERDQYLQRFDIMKPVLAEMIGEEDTARFCELFLDALDDKDGNKGTELFYNRFITIGVK